MTRAHTAERREADEGRMQTKRGQRRGLTRAVGLLQRLAHAARVFARRHIRSDQSAAAAVERWSCNTKHSQPVGTNGSRETRQRTARAGVAVRCGDQGGTRREVRNLVQRRLATETQTADKMTSECHVNYDQAHARQLPTMVSPARLGSRAPQQPQCR